MLILSRKLKESVVMGGGGGLERLLKVTVLHIAGGKVKLGFEVDADVPVHRQEIWERLSASREQNSQGSTPTIPGDPTI